MSSAPQGVLDGITILELGQVIAGNFGGVLLADMGAEVIKIEPLNGDTARNPSIAPYRGESAIHLCMNRGKKSVSLDLKSEEGKELFLRLVEQADAVIDNFRPGVMARLGIDHAELRKRNADIVTVSVTGFGETGPSKLRPAFDLVVQAYSGHMYITGEPDHPPSRVGIPLADISGGIFACLSVLAALAGRGVHGKGAHADVSMLDSLVSMLSYDALEHLNTGRDVQRMGTAHSHMVPWQAFEVLDGHVVVAAREEKFWQRLCDALERPDLKSHPKTVDNTARVANRTWLVAELEASFATKTKAEWEKILDEHDIPSGPVNNFSEVFSDPQIVARGAVGEYDHATLGPVKYVRSPSRFDGFEQPNLPAPMLGEHTRDVLVERLGLSADQLDDLAGAGHLRAWKESE
jgi:crotonobetainyl-CoA:carnitine CoA-transferase CaiB-like acyl-CoA transferase